MPYKLNPHTADVRLFVYGEDIEELFRSALYGMCKILSPSIDDFIIEKEIDFEVNSIDQTGLLVDFLNEALFFMNDNKILIHSVRIKELKDTHISGIFEGFYVKEFEEDIKAATYHEAEIIKQYGYYETSIILDI